MVAFNCHTNTKKIIPKCEHWDLVAKYSDLQKLLRVTSYILRFIDRLLIKCGIKNKRVVNCNSKLFKTEWFQVSYQLCCFKTPSVSELIRARLVWVFVVQNSHFCKDIELLKMDKDEKLNNSNLNSVNPYLQDNLLRVGGRVQASLLDPDEKHPIILPFKCKLSNLVIKFCHEKKLHAGIRLTYSTVRQEFWIVKGRNMVKAYINKCNTCIRYRASTLSQKMGILPSHRVTRPDKPFRLAGVDYAGPYDILRFKGHGSRTYKCYIAVFVCMSTKAVHLELVTGYSSEDFIAAFRRFTSTRGQCSGLYSDQGTTFVRADRILRQMYMDSSEY